MENGDTLQGMIILAMALAIYLAPTIIAAARRHRSEGAVFALNLFLGWTFVGWVAALVWALTYQPRKGEAR
jgi:hypothetical protein